MKNKLKSNWKWIVYFSLIFVLVLPIIIPHIGKLASYMILFQDFPYNLTMIFTVLISFTVHELAHALAAYKLGDDTAKSDNRLSLNPFVHFDFLGTVLFLVFGYGWAKPVVVDAKKLKNPKIDIALISISGPVSNFCLAFLAGLMMLIMLHCKIYPPQIIAKFIFEFCIANISIGIFNLIPIAPLDGSKVLMSFFPDRCYNRIQNSKSINTLNSIVFLLLVVLVISGLLYKHIISPMTYHIFDLITF